jgi:hypothetical protein
MKTSLCWVMPGHAFCSCISPARMLFYACSLYVSPDLPSSVNCGPLLENLLERVTDNLFDHIDCALSDPWVWIVIVCHSRGDCPITGMEYISHVDCAEPDCQIS